MGRSENSYQLMQSAGPARLYSHLVVAHKFAMKLAKHKQKAGRSVYKLSKAALTKINVVLQGNASLLVSSTQTPQMEVVI